ncbi:hypothetical protein DVK07_00225 [Halorubrum sp. Atlit-26R]|nr:hypothetical protein DVK07_00225 [Halorubrum sp. Atlit-26R]
MEAFAVDPLSTVYKRTAEALEVIAARWSPAYKRGNTTRSSATVPETYRARAMSDPKSGTNPAPITVETAAESLIHQNKRLRAVKPDTNRIKPR